jgi:hypothetical protein
MCWICKFRIVLTSIPVLSASPLSAFVLVLWGFELGETSVVAGMMEVSPSTLGGPLVVDLVEAAWGSAAETVPFRGMAVCGICVRVSQEDVAKGKGEEIRELVCPGSVVVGFRTICIGAAAVADA